ncbi:hypothetical protein INT44_001059 [Umbelopsis vinacea]|uniref:CAP-Gly domain-containing protein n=1 Tax=Umbelopsis vinacea TaxID=44442 RepID=A0A8H7Q9J4_9FUNG|nr:hypothetical protein INT44_001059 [Umbelopsis vinacea]
MSRLPKGPSPNSRLANPYGTLPRNTDRYSEQTPPPSLTRRATNVSRVSDPTSVQPRTSKSTTLRRGTTTTRTSIASLDEMFQESNRYSTASSLSGRTTPQRSSIASSATTISPKPSKSTKALNRVSSVSSSRRSVVPEKVASSQSDGQLRIGQRVAMHSLGLCGTLRFLGPTEFKSGIWAGVELDIVGTGKNDGSVSGIDYFTCPPQTGLFLLSTKVTPLSEPDTDSVRSDSPSNRSLDNGRQRSASSASNTSDRPPIRTASAHNAALAAARISSGSRASKYLGMTANQLTQGRTNTNVINRTKKSVTPLTRSSTNASRTTTPISRKSHIPPGSATRRISTASATSSAMASPTPPPQSPDISRHSYVSSTDGGEDEALHNRLHRLLGDAISQAPDENVMRLQQLQLRVEVLEAENKFLKLENAQNKSAEQILEKSLLLHKQNGDSEDVTFTLEGHQAIVDQLKSQLEESQQKWDSDKARLEESKQKLTMQTEQFNQKRDEWNAERENAEHRSHDIEREKSRLDSKIMDLEEKLAVSEANAAAAIAQQAALSRPRETDADEELSEEMYDQRRRLEAEMEEVHDKMANLTEAMRAKDMFLHNMSEQVESYRNMCEEKEREIRRIKSDFEREKRDKDRLLEEISELETRLKDLDDAGESKMQLEKKNRELEETKRRFDREKRELSEQLQRSMEDKIETEEDHQSSLRRLEQTVEDLKKAGFESIELYESSVEIHKLEMEKMNAVLAEERRRNKMMDVEREELRTAGLDAIEAYESTIHELKAQHSDEIEHQEQQVKQLQEEVTDLRKQIDQLVNASQGGKDEEVEKIKLVWDSERKRLEEHINSAKQSLADQQQQQQLLRQENEKLADNLKQFEKLSAEKINLETRLQEAERDYEELSKLRNKSLEDMGGAFEGQKKAEAESRSLQDTVANLHNELEQQKQELEILRQSKDQVEEAMKNTDSSSSAIQQQEQRIANLQQEVEKLEAQNQMIVKQKEQLALTVEQLEKFKAAQLSASKSTTTSKDDQRHIKELVNKAEKYEEEIASLRHKATDAKKEAETLSDDNKKLNIEYEKLLEAHKSVENECLKLMDEVERLHSEGLMGLDDNDTQGQEPENSHIVSDASSPDNAKLILLQKQYAEKQTQLDRINVQHAAQIREIQQSLSDLERAKQRETHALNKDIAELESLIESKIFKEADLEEAVEAERKTIKRLRDEISELKSQIKDFSARSNGKSYERKASITNSSSVKPPSMPIPATAKKTNDALYCEICEQHGHDIISCTALLSEADFAAENKRYCENCEEYGLHATDNCPNGDETF